MQNLCEISDYGYAQLVTAFAVSATASNWDRLSKPFNPLLGETYELDRSADLQNTMISVSLYYDVADYREMN